MCVSGTYGCLGVPIGVCMYLWECVCTYRCVHVPMGVCMYLWECVCTYRRVYVPMGVCMYLWACVCTYGSVYVPMGVYVCTHLNPDSLISSLLAETRERHVAAINSQQFCLEMTSTLRLSCLPARGQIQQNNSQRQMTNTTWKTRVGRYSSRWLYSV